MSVGVTAKAAPVGLPSELPRGWQSKQLRRVASAKASNVDKKSVDGQASVLLCNYVDVYYNRQIVSTLDFMEATATDEQTVTFELQQGDVLITKDSETPSDIGVSAFVPADLPGVLCGYHLSHIRPGKELSGAFLTYCFQAGGIQDHFYSNATGVTRFGLSRSDIGTCPIPLPPLDVQRAIAAHLDRETAKIDTLIAKKRELIAKLKEQRSALISRTVTCGLPPEAAKAVGLDPNPPIKDSGVEWFGRVPEHWQISCLKRNWNVLDCKHLTAEYVDDGFPLASIREVQSRFVDLTNAKRTTSDFYFQLIEGGREPRPHDLIFSRNATVGEVAQVREDQGKFALGQDVCLIRKKYASHSSDFLQIVLGSDACRSQLENVMVGSTFKRVNVEDIKALWIPVPPVHEQLAVANFLLSQLRKVDGLVATVETAITRLTVYRAALITAAVTGQLVIASAG